MSGALDMCPPQRCPPQRCSPQRCPPQRCPTTRHCRTALAGSAVGATQPLAYASVFVRPVDAPSDSTLATAPSTAASGVTLFRSDGPPVGLSGCIVSVHGSQHCSGWPGTPARPRNVAVRSDRPPVNRTSAVLGRAGAIHPYPWCPPAGTEGGPLLVKVLPETEFQQLLLAPLMAPGRPRGTLLEALCVIRCADRRHRVCTRLPLQRRLPLRLPTPGRTLVHV